MVKIGEARKT